MGNWSLTGEGVIMDGARVVAVCDKKEEAERIVNLVNYDQDIREAIGMSIFDLEIKIGGSE